jgi:hypothetical protein
MFPKNEVMIIDYSLIVNCFIGIKALFKGIITKILHADSIMFIDYTVKTAYNYSEQFK